MEIPIDYHLVELTADAFKQKFKTMSIGEKIRLAAETDRIFNAGMDFWYAGDKDRAAICFLQALAVYPINSDAISMLGDYFEYTDYDKSMAFYELAIREDSLLQKTSYQLACFYEWKHDYANAQRCYALWEEKKAFIKRNGFVTTRP